MALGRRPPREVAVGRDDRVPIGDEESLLEDLTRLRAQLSELRQKAADFREEIRRGERENSKMDKLLQELLSKAKGGTGVSGSVLDQLREDLQALLRAKRHANEARQQLDEKESKLVAIKQIRQDLKDTKLSQLEDDVHRAREEAKVKAEKLEAQGLYQGRPAEALHEEIVAAQNALAEIHQKTAKLQDERVHFESMAKEHVEQTRDLEEKRYMVEQQKEQCEERLRELGDVQGIFRQTKEGCDDLKQRLAEVKAAVRAGESLSQRSLPNWRLEEELLEPGFQPLDQEADLRAVKLLRSLQRAEGEVLSALRREDGDQDGRLDPFELSQALRKLLPQEDAQLEAANALFAALKPGLQPTAQGSCALVDLTLGAQLQARHAHGAPAAFDCNPLRWAARRSGVPERDVRQRLAMCLRQAERRVSVEGTKVAMQLGLNEGDATALGQHLERYQERFCYSLPAWRIRSHKSKATLLGRFVHQVARYREALLPFLQDDTLGLEEFLELGEKLGGQWSEDDLSEIALLLDVSPQDTEGHMALPPIISAKRLRLALEPNGFPSQFPQAAGLCSHDLLKAIEDSAGKPGRRGLPSAAAPPPPPEEVPAAESPVAPPAPGSPKKTRPESPTKSAGEASYGDDEFDDDFEDPEDEDEA